MSDADARLAHARPAMAEAMTAAGANMAVVFAALPILMDALAGALAGDAPPDGATASEPDWQALADRAGEHVDLAAWQAAERRLPYHAHRNWFPAQAGLAAE